MNNTLKWETRINSKHCPSNRINLSIGCKKKLIFFFLLVVQNLMKMIFFKMIFFIVHLYCPQQQEFITFLYTLSIYLKSISALLRRTLKLITRRNKIFYCRLGLISNKFFTYLITQSPFYCFNILLILFWNQSFLIVNR